MDQFFSLLLCPLYNRSKNDEFWKIKSKRNDGEIEVETETRKEEPGHAKKIVIDRLTEIINEIKPPKVIKGFSTNEGEEKSSVNDIESAKGVKNQNE